MQTEMFLKIEGPVIEGESRTDGHEGEIDVRAWQWEQSQPAGSSQSPGGAGGRVQVQDLSIVKSVDAATPPLILANAEGTVFDKATLVNRRPGEGFDYLVIELNEVVVSALSIDADTGLVSPNEIIGLRFAEFIVIYTPQQPDGSAGTPIVGGWNLMTNQRAG